MIMSVDATFRFATTAFLAAVPIPLIWLKFDMASIQPQAPITSLIGSPSFLL